MDLVPSARTDPLCTSRVGSNMFQHPKGFSPSVPVNPETVSIRPVAAVTSVPRLAFGTDWVFLWRRKSLIALTVAAALLLSLGADLVMTARYRAVSQSLIG